jgi:hypothetical protein
MTRSEGIIPPRHVVILLADFAIAVAIAYTIQISGRAGAHDRFGDRSFRRFQVLKCELDCESVLNVS